MHRRTRLQAAHPHHWLVHRNRMHIHSAPVRDDVAVPEASSIAADTAEDGELAASPWVGLYYAAEGT